MITGLSRSEAKVEEPINHKAQNRTSVGLQERKKDPAELKTQGFHENCYGYGRLEAYTWMKSVDDSCYFSIVEDS